MVMLMFYPPFAQQFTTHFLDISSHSSSFNTPFVWFFFSQRVPFQVLIYLYISSRFMRDYDAQFYRILISYTRQGKASQDITGDVKMGRFEFLNQSGQQILKKYWYERNEVELKMIENWLKSRGQIKIAHIFTRNTLMIFQCQSVNDLIEKMFLFCFVSKATPNGFRANDRSHIFSLSLTIFAQIWWSISSSPGYLWRERKRFSLCCYFALFFSPLQFCECFFFIISLLDFPFYNLRGFNLVSVLPLSAHNL